MKSDNNYKVIYCADDDDFRVYCKYVINAVLKDTTKII